MSTKLETLQKMHGDIGDTISALSDLSVDCSHRPMIPGMIRAVIDILEDIETIFKSDVENEEAADE